MAAPHFLRHQVLETGHGLNGRDCGHEDRNARSMSTRESTPGRVRIWLMWNSTVLILT